MISVADGWPNFSSADFWRNEFFGGRGQNRRLTGLGLWDITTIMRPTSKGMGGEAVSQLITSSQQSVSQSQSVAQKSVTTSCHWQPEGRQETCIWQLPLLSALQTCRWCDPLAVRGKQEIAVLRFVADWCRVREHDGDKSMCMLLTQCDEVASQNIPR